MLSPAACRGRKVHMVRARRAHLPEGRFCLPLLGTRARVAWPRSRVESMCGDGSRPKSLQGPKTPRRRGSSSVCAAICPRRVLMGPPSARRGSSAARSQDGPRRARGEGIAEGTHNGVSLSPNRPPEPVSPSFSGPKSCWQGAARNAAGTAVGTIRDLRARTPEEDTDGPAGYRPTNRLGRSLGGRRAGTSARTGLVHLGEVPLPQPNVGRRHFQQLVVDQEVQRLFQAEPGSWR